METHAETTWETSSAQLVSPADYLELSRLVIEHAWRTDHGRSDTLHELYVAEGQLDLGTGPLRGREAIHEWGKRIVDATPWRVIRHHCGDMRFVMTGSDRAEGTTLMSVYMVAGDHPAISVPWNVGEDQDQYVRTRQGWRLLSRRWVNLFTRGDAIDVS